MIFENDFVFKVEREEAGSGELGGVEAFLMLVIW